MSETRHTLNSKETVARNFKVVLAAKLTTPGDSEIYFVQKRKPSFPVKYITSLQFISNFSFEVANVAMKLIMKPNC